MQNSESYQFPVIPLQTVLILFEQTGFSHRKLTQLFNQLYHAQTGISVGRTWVQQLLIQTAYESMQKRCENKHHVPKQIPILKQWSVDTARVSDEHRRQHQVVGMIDCGPRLNVALRFVRRFNGWTLLGSLFLAIGEYGKPSAIKSDNHAVFHSSLVRCVLACCGIKQRFSPPGQPWCNGYIERFFGTFKFALRDYLIFDEAHLKLALASFRDWYNEVRPHQHLEGRTPWQTWKGIDPYQQAPKRMLYFCAWGGRLRGWVLRH